MSIGVSLLYKSVDISKLISNTGGVWSDTMEQPLNQPILDSALEHFRKFYGFVKGLQHGNLDESPDLVFAQVMSALK